MSTSKKDKMLAEVGSNLADAVAPPSVGSTPRPGQGGPPPRPARLVGVEKSRDAVSIELDRIAFDPDQPRKEFTEAKMEEMLASLGKHGQLQPVRVMYDPATDKYLLLIGERRVRASLRLGWKTIAAVVHDRRLTPEEILDIQVAENLHRDDFKPIELANAIRRKIGFGHTQEHVAEEYKITQSAVSQFLSLLRLPGEVQEQVEQGTLSTRAAVHVAKLESPDEQREVAAQVVEEKLTEAEVAEVVKKKRAPRKGGSAKPRAASVLPRKFAVKDWRHKATGIRVEVRKGRANFGYDELIQAIDDFRREIASEMGAVA